MTRRIAVSRWVVTSRAVAAICPGSRDRALDHTRGIRAQDARDHAAHEQRFCEGLDEFGRAPRAQKPARALRKGDARKVRRYSRRNKARRVLQDRRQNAADHQDNEGWGEKAGDMIRDDPQKVRRLGAVRDRQGSRAIQQAGQRIGDFTPRARQHQCCDSEQSGNGHQGVRLARGRHIALLDRVAELLFRGVLGLGVAILLGHGCA